MLEKGGQAPAVLLRASAGSGKTYALSSRFLALLLAGEEPSRILATTFTRKAAGEIRARVLSRLAKAALHQEMAEQLGDDIGISCLSTTRCRDALLRLVKSQHQLNICTLDSFFIKIASGFGFEIGVAPGWRIGDQREERVLLREAVFGLSLGVDHSNLLSLLRLLAKGKLFRRVQQQMEIDLLALQQLFCESEEQSWGWLTSPEKLSKDRVDSLSRELEYAPLPKTQKGKSNAVWEKARVAAVASLRQGDFLSFISGGFVAKRCAEETHFARNEIPQEVCLIIDPLIIHSAGVLLEELGQQNEAGYKLAAWFDSQQQSLRESKRLISFNDVKRRLARAAVMHRLDDLYYRLDSRIAHLLLDEFQDTSRTEWQVLFPLVEEVLSKVGEDYSFFCVGDVKQAIYGWRGGVAEVFDSIERHWPHVECISSETSFRCSSAIIESVNTIFENISSSPCLAQFGQAAAAWQERFLPHKTVAPDAGRGYVCMEEVAGGGTKEELAIEPAYQRAARRIADISRLAPGVSIGVLLRRNVAVKEMIFALQQPGIGVQASEEGGNPLTSSMAVVLILSLLRFADHPGDTISAFHLAVSPIASSIGLAVGVSSAETLERAARKLRCEILEWGFTDFVSSWAHRLIPFCDVAEQEQLRRLVELSCRFSGAQSGRATEFIHYVERERVESIKGGDVRVMTVHQSKGLEFDVVVLPELSFPLIRGGQEKLMVYRASQLEFPSRVSFAASAAIRGLSPALKEMYDQGCAERLKEALSLFYVALTRARTALYLFVEEEKTQDQLSYAGILRERLIDSREGSDGVLYSLGDERWWEKLAPKEPDYSEREGLPALTVVSKKRPAIRVPRGLTYLNPSELEGGEAADIERALALKGSRVLVYGRAIHRLFQCVGWLDDEQPRLDELRVALAGVVGEHEKSESWIQRFLEMIQVDSIAQCLRRATYTSGLDVRLELERELPFAVRQERTLLSGTFDRVVLKWQGESLLGAEIIDFKTDQLSSSQKLMERAQYYAPQLEAYRAALGSMMKIDIGRIECKLLFVEIGEVVEC